mmetsp:Transcript_35964/g.83931  ORF Transcript_35964/g.83931 Transcript_35964/m.83931 type:complete len:798 (-) Transcript_35964:2396-4789(-)
MSGKQKSTLAGKKRPRDQTCTNHNFEDGGGKRTSSNYEVIELSDSDNDIECYHESSSNFVDLVDEEGFPAYNPGDFVGPADSDSDIELVEGPKNDILESEPIVGTDGGGDIEIVGAKNVQPTMPHLRQDCPKHKFVPSKKIPRDDCSENQLYCDKCYCFLCDEKVEHCRDWKRHCCSSNNGKYENTWKKIQSFIKKASALKNLNEKQRQVLMRQVDKLLDKFQKGNASKIKNKKRTSSSMSMINLYQKIMSSTSASSSVVDREITRTARARNLRLGTGPFPPSADVAKTDPNLVECRWCSWYSLRKNWSISDPPTCSDYCHRCGRVPSEKDFNKDQGISRLPPPASNYLLFGTKEIPFRIRSHDPRNFTSKRWKKNWEEEKWSFSLEEMNYETWLHRIGVNPKLESIIRLLPVVDDSSIPTDGEFYQPIVHERKGSLAVSAEETNAILIHDFHHKNLLHALYMDDGNRFNGLERRTVCTISSTWNKAHRKGILKLKLYLMPGVFKTDPSSKFNFSSIIAAWFSVGPFRLQDLTSGWKANENDDRRCINFSMVPYPWISKENIRKKNESRKLLRKETIDNFNIQSERSDGRSYFSSSGFSCCGGTSNSNNSLEAVLGAYFKDCISESVISQCEDVFDGYVNLWTLKMHGIQWAHRAPFIKSTKGSIIKPFFPHFGFLATQDLPLLQDCKNDANTIINMCKTTNGILSHLENTGHCQVDKIEGLNVDLLDYQKQTVAWALERENLDGGLESLLWAKVPTVGFEGPLYYSPAIDLFRKDKPPHLRGGMICEEMGLGKVLI